MKQKAQVWVVSRDSYDEIKILLLKRNPDQGSLWQPVTGGVDEGETPEQGAQRELYEETGFGLGLRVLPLHYEFEFEGRWGRARETVFWVEVSQNYPDPKLEPKEHCDFEWVSVFEVESRIPFETQRFGFQRLLKIL